MVSIAVLVTSYCRPATTLLALTSVFDQVGLEDAKISVILVDASPNAETLVESMKTFPQILGAEAPENTFWAAGMELAWKIAEESNPDFYMLFNDDTVLEPNAISRLLDTYRSLSREQIIVVGATQSALGSGERSYGGVRRASKLNPLSFRGVSSGPFVVSCDTFNGNAVLIPRSVCHVLGRIDGSYQHGFADFDYGLRAQKAGIPTYQASSFVGWCARNTERGTWRDPGVGIAKSWRLLLGPKGVPVSDWRTFCKRHAGISWPLWTAYPYSVHSLRTSSWFFRDCKTKSLRAVFRSMRSS